MNRLCELNLVFRLFLFIFTLVFTLCSPVMMISTYSCTAFKFTVGGKQYIGKSFDFGIMSADVVVNLKGVKKKNLHKESEKVIGWTSKYGSVTFNMLGKELPYGGMNEESLVVEIAFLEGAGFKGDSDGQTYISLNESQFIQYLLDNFKSVDEVVNELDKIRISPLIPKGVHYSVCDKSGKCVSIDPVDAVDANVNNYNIFSTKKNGNRDTYRSLKNLIHLEQNVINITDNSGNSNNKKEFNAELKDNFFCMTYKEDAPYVFSNGTDYLLYSQYDELKEKASVDGRVKIFTDPKSTSRSRNLSSECRYNNAKYLIENIPSQISDISNFGFSILDAVKGRNGWNKWQIFYDLDAKKISFRANKSSASKIKTIDMNKLDFNLQTKEQTKEQNQNNVVLRMPIDSSKKEDVTNKFEKYSSLENKKLSTDPLVLLDFSTKEIKTIQNFSDDPNPNNSNECEIKFDQTKPSLLKKCLAKAKVWPRNKF
ncbi:MAG: linear amide C-N hydrolase [Oligoflexia bacterium]|nr:linear amide C-N hydrolase [Oligoflexia bacterium]